MKFYPILFVALIPAGAFAGEFDGCKGLSVTKSRDLSSVDVSAELEKASRRINEICGKVLPKKLEAIDTNAKACSSGASVEIGPGLAAQMKRDMETQMSAFRQRVKTACDSMKKTMEESKGYCAERKSSLDAVNAKIAALESAAGDQASSQESVSSLYGEAEDVYRQTAEKAAKAKEKIYSHLPDKDENRGRQMRKGNESTSTKDPKTDKLIASWKSTLTLLQKNNKKKAACGKLASKGGQLDQVGDILKNNLWPNGKVAARAIARIEKSDRAKEQEFSAQKAKAESLKENTQTLGEGKSESEQRSDISGTEKAEKKMTEQELSDLNKKARESQALQAETVDICKKQGGCGSEDAVSAALKQAQTNDVSYESTTRSPAQLALEGNLGINSTFPVENMDELNRSQGVRPIVGGICIKQRLQNKDLLGRFDIYGKCN